MSDVSRSSSLYQQYVQQMEQVQDLNSALALLHWDNEVNAPAKGASHRGKQIATLSTLAHQQATTPALGHLLEQLYTQQQDLGAQEAANIRLSLDHYQRSQKLPAKFVRRLATAKANAFQAWLKARAANDFGIYQPALQAIVDLMREQAELWGYADHPYDALLHEYERGSTVAELDQLFAEVRQELVPLARTITEQGRSTSTAFLKEHYDSAAQWQFGLDLLAQMGFDFDAGRQDRSEHPFTIAFSSNDVRVTTRIDERNPMDMIGSCIHEGGHALYELGLPIAQYGLPLGSATSLGIHESQSRLWENHVGLSRAYWQANYGAFQQAFPKPTEGISLEHFYRAINQIAPNFIRTTADELHYHLHVLIRYDLEKGLIEGQYQVADLETIWNDRYQAYLHLTVPDAKRGILQDVHWAEGLFGYFPTYSLGSFYAAQFFAKAQEAIPALEQEIAQGNCKPLLDWLRQNIHQYGQRYTSGELCEQITGERLTLRYFLQHIRRKYSAIYDIAL